MAHDVSSLNTVFKYIQKDLKDLKPNSSILFDMVPSREGDAIGRKYLQAVVLSYELGFTWGDGTGFSYNDDVAGVYDEAEVESNSVVLKSRIAIEALERMKGDKALLSHVGLRSSQMKMSLMKMAELDMLYGRSGIGKIASAAAVDTGPTPDEVTLTITDATWAPGIFGGMVGAKLDGYNGASKLNANAVMTITAIDYDNKTVTVSGDNTDLTALAATHDLFFRGSKANQMYGIHYQLDNATTLFGIDAAAHDLWKASEFDVAGALTTSKILQAVEKAQSKGGLDQDSILVISTKTFQSLASDILPLRQFDQSYKAEAEVGSDRIKINTSAGKVEVVPHPFVKQGFGYLIPKKAMCKVGASSEISFRIPGKKEEEYFEPLEGSDAVQMLGRYNFQVFIETPAQCCLLTGITNA